MWDYVPPQIFPGLSSLGTLTDPNNYDSNAIILTLQSTLASALPTDYESFLWQNTSTGSDDPTGLDLASRENTDSQFLAHVPYETNTGLIKQYLPSIASSTSGINITSPQWPGECVPGGNVSFYSQFGNDTDYTFQVCIPQKTTFEPRQIESLAIVENMYITAKALSADSELPNSTIQLTANTRIAYFELPNTMNGNKIGRISFDPLTECDADPQCITQTQWRQDPPEGDSGTFPGPLHLLAEAIFGDGSLLGGLSTTRPTRWEKPDDSAPRCETLMPMNAFISG